MNYYNDFDKDSAAWLRHLVEEGFIPPGKVDDRPVQEVEAKDLEEFTQHHFFAGIGGWPLALTLAGWPIDRPVWTGSCPCQPFSTVGKRRGFEDERHIWGDWYRLIRECRPSVVVGEQTAGAGGIQWLSSVRADLESGGYAVAAADLPAACIGAPHVRQRLFWMGYAHGDPEAQALSRGASPGGPEVSKNGARERLEVAECPALRTADPVSWHEYEWAEDIYGVSRPTQPGTPPLADGLPRRPAAEKGYGNAIVPQVGALFLEAVLDVIGR